MQLTLGKHTTQLWGEWLPKGHTESGALPAQAFQGHWGHQYQGHLRGNLGCWLIQEVSRTFFCSQYFKKLFHLGLLRQVSCPLVQTHILHN